MTLRRLSDVYNNVDTHSKEILISCDVYFNCFLTFKDQSEIHQIKGYFGEL